MQNKRYFTASVLSVCLLLTGAAAAAGCSKSNQTNAAGQTQLPGESRAVTGVVEAASTFASLGNLQITQIQIDNNNKITGQLTNLSKQKLKITQLAFTIYDSNGTALKNQPGNLQIQSGSDFAPSQVKTFTLTTGAGVPRAAKYKIAAAYIPE
ncbi:MAG: hypothetical protein JWN30_2749 [Bacilli bacterium]|nr:hypothetical protein [Bacilli bacterium]